MKSYTHNACRLSSQRALTIQRGAIFWLLLLPSVDVALFVVFSSQIRSDIATFLLGVLTSICFWVGGFLLIQRILSFAQNIRRATVRYAVRIGLRFLLVGIHFYFLFIWAFIVANGHMPNPESIIFLIDNMERVPQHALQTAPLMSLALVTFSLITAWITERVIEVVGIDRPTSSGGKGALAMVFTLVAWYATAPLGLNLSPAVFTLNAGVQEKIDARAKAYVAGLGGWSPIVAASPVTKNYPVIVILVESLRYDLLTKNPEAIPFLKTLYEENIGFEFSYATASHSNLTDLAFWYSQYPLRGENKESYPTDARWKGTSLFKVFKDSGYPTAYISSQNERWGDMINWLKTPDVDFFFDSENYSGETWENYDDADGLGAMLKRGLVTAGKIEDSQTLNIAKHWISKQPDTARFFLGMNLQNTHFSYVMPPQGIEPYQPSALGFKAIYYNWPEVEKGNVRNRYLNAVVNVDKMLADFVLYLKQQGIWDECMFVVVGDNGEGFYEHGFGNHSGPMYDEAVRTFSVIKPPKSIQLGATQIGYPISHIDIAATIPQLAGIKLPESFQGLPIKFDGGPDRPVYMYSNAIVRQFATVSWPWKLLITEFPEAREELYRLDSDPQESFNLAAENQSEKARLYESLKFWISVQKTYYSSAAYESRVPPQHL